MLKKQEQRIASCIRRDGLKALKAEKNKRDKVFLYLADISFLFARIIVRYEGIDVKNCWKRLYKNKRG
mgnify:CR=1 FL=1